MEKLQGNQQDEKAQSRRSQIILSKDDPIPKLFGMENPYGYYATASTMWADPKDLSS